VIAATADGLRGARPDPVLEAPRLELQGVAKAFGRVRVLDGIDLAMAAGERVAVLGVSGVGKTTLLRLVAGLDLPDAGQIVLDGEVVSRPRWGLAPHRRSVGYAFQRSALWPHMTVASNVAFGMHRLPAADRRARVADLLARLELDGLGDRYPDQLSGGQSRRVALARALAPEPALLLFDEPLTNLEGPLRERLLGEIADQAARTAATVLYVTHDRDEAERAAPRRLRLEAGRLVPDAAGDGMRPGQRQ
jgi:iron(III) transport system ATP-binding protein